VVQGLSGTVISDPAALRKRKKPTGTGRASQAASGSEVPTGLERPTGTGRASQAASGSEVPTGLERPTGTGRASQVSSSPSAKETLANQRVEPVRRLLGRKPAGPTGTDRTGKASRPRGSGAAGKGTVLGDSRKPREG